MKQLILVITVFAIVVMTDSCIKAPLEKCQIVCKNGGIVNQNCGCNCPSGFTGSRCETLVPPVPSVPTCQTNHTATVIFNNRSVNGYTYVIYWDNVPLTDVTSGNTKSYPAGSNIQRKIYAKATKPNGTTIESTIQTVIFKECSTNIFTWTF